MSSPLIAIMRLSLIIKSDSEIDAVSMNGIIIAGYHNDNNEATVTEYKIDFSCAWNDSKKNDSDELSKPIKKPFLEGWRS